jgi:hypothetical protein
MLKLQLDHDFEQRCADSADINTVNETMRVELQNALNEAWYQKARRPANARNPLAPIRVLTKRDLVVKI